MPVRHFYINFSQGEGEQFQSHDTAEDALASITALKADTSVTTIRLNVVDDTELYNGTASAIPTDVLDAYLS